MRKVGESYHRVGVAHYAALRPILEPRPLVCTTGYIERDYIHTIGGLSSIKKILSQFLNLLVSTLPLSSFQNGLIDLLTIIISHPTNN